MILLIDNYDSFSYNLYQMTGEINPDIEVVRNDGITVEQIKERKPSHIILSPGPGRPENAGICIDAVKELSGTIPILGVCLGHQAICAAFGGTITHAKNLMHGKQSNIKVINPNVIFEDLPKRFAVARYHSLAADSETLPPELVVAAETDDGEVMAVCHKTHKTFGLQFHPESILTPDGTQILKNFLEI